MIEYRDHITRDMLRAGLEELFVFGDNLQRRGLDGQAKEMRGEPNAVGIPTKRRPLMSDDAFLSDEDCYTWSIACGVDVIRLLTFNGTIIWPKAGSGTGLAELPNRAPRIWQAIERLRISLEHDVIDGFLQHF